MWKGKVMGGVKGYLGRNENALKKVLRFARFDVQVEYIYGFV